jgi:CTX phage RstB protein
MKATIIGTLLKEGTSMKTGTAKPYAIAEIYVMVPFSERDLGAKGYMGGNHKVNPEVVKKINHLPLPLDVELDTRDVMLYGKQSLEIVDIRPVQRAAVVQKVA